MKIKNKILTLLLCTSISIVQCQEETVTEPIVTAAVLNIHSNINAISPEIAGSLLRIELVKSKKFKVFDKHDILEMGAKNKLEINECYGKDCLQEIGKNIQVDKMFSGSIDALGKKIVVSLKVLDIKSGKYDKTTIMEFVDAPIEIQAMIQLTLNDMLGIKNKMETLNSLIYYQQPPETPKTDITNNGPRVGVALVLGEMASRMQAPVSEGGWDAAPVVSQFGYQIEKEYLSAGDFHALIEFLFMLSGPEQQLFNPKMVIMNGFRSGKTGLEFAFGPSFGLEREANSFYHEGKGKWQLQSEWVGIVEDSLYQANPYEIVPRMDSRGRIKPSAGWVMAVGKTFNSGYLNIPVNLYASFNKYGWQTGLSLGFNLKKSN